MISGGAVSQEDACFRAIRPFSSVQLMLPSVVEHLSPAVHFHSLAKLSKAASKGLIGLELPLVGNGYDKSKWVVEVQIFIISDTHWAPPKIVGFSIAEIWGISSYSLPLWI